MNRNYVEVSGFLSVCFGVVHAVDCVVSFGIVQGIAVRLEAMIELQGF